MDLAVRFFVEATERIESRTPTFSPAPAAGKDLLSPLVGKRAIIVEDEGITQMHLKRLLKAAGAQVIGAAKNGEEGRDLVLREKPDLVLMDIQMPVMNGIDATRQILASYPVCIVMVTAFSDADYRALAREAGASGYLVKPIAAGSFVPELEAAMAAFSASPAR